MNDLRNLLQHEVQDLISVEDQIIEAMPAMIASAQNGDLKKALEQHFSITQKQRSRLDEVQKSVGGEQNTESGGENKGLLSGLMSVFGGGEKCKGMEGIITEGQKIMKADMNADVKDAAIIACAQKIEHYEICGYGTARAYARELELKEAERLLQETLAEEYEADDRLTQLALGDINRKAEVAGKRSNSSPKKAGGSSAAKNGNAKAAAKKSEAPKKAQAVNGKVAAKKAAAKTNQQPKKAAAKASGGSNDQNKKATVKSAAPKKAGAKK